MTRQIRKGYARLLYIVLSLTMVCTMLPMLAFAAGGDSSITVDGTKGYTLNAVGLNKAVTDIADGGIITLGGDIDTTSGIMHATPKKVILDLNGHTIKSSAYDGIYVNNGADLTVRSTKDGGKIEHTGRRGAISNIVGKATITIESGTITSTAVYGIYISNEANITVTGGRISTDQGAIFSNKGNITISGSSTITSGSINSECKTIEIANGALVISGTPTIRNTSANSFAGCIAAFGGSAGISGGTISAKEGTAIRSFIPLSISGNTVVTSESATGNTIEAHNVLTLTDAAQVTNTAASGIGSAIYLSGSSATYSLTSSNTVGKIAPAYPVSGTIIGSDTSSGIAATLQLKYSGGVSIGSAVTANANGTYSINVPTGATYTIDVSMAGYTAGKISDFTMKSSGITKKDLTLTKESSGDITITKAINISTVAPVMGGTISDDTVSSPTGANVSTVTWSADNGSTWNTAVGSFSPNTAYQSKYVYTAKNGYVFDRTFEAADVTVTNIGSGSKTAVLSDGDKTLTVTVTWPLITSVASSESVVTSWTSPKDPTVNEAQVTKTVGNEIRSLVIDAVVSDKATWKLYSDEGCTNEIENKTMILNIGANTAYAKVTAEDGITNKVYTVTIKREASTNSGDSGGSNNSGNRSSKTSNQAAPKNDGTQITVNGKSETAGTANTTTENNRTTTTVVVDQKKLEEKLNTEGNNAVVTIPVNNKADAVYGELNGEIIKIMENKQAVVEIKTEDLTYTLPAKQINIDDVSKQVGKNVEMKDIKVKIEVSKSTADTVKTVENSAKKGEFTIVAPPVEFSVTCTYGDKKVDVSRFNAYVERSVLIPDGVDPSKITTGIVVDKDETVRHVPTKVIKADGKYYAKLNSLTNSTYSVVYNPKTFKDTTSHWAKEAINDMGSRMVISGVGEGNFEPDREMTRGEFAAIIVRSLGLKPEGNNSAFTDVNSSDWNYGYIETAYKYNIISGYEDNKFKKEDKITREQAMVMIARAMKITGMKIEFSDSEIDSILSNFEDSNKSSEYAKNGIATCIKNGIISGKNGNIINPKENITRAEVASIIKRLLQKSNLI